MDGGCGLYDSVQASCAPAIGKTPSRSAEAVEYQDRSPARRSVSCGMQEDGWRAGRMANTSWRLSSRLSSPSRSLDGTRADCWASERCLSLNSCGSNEIDPADERYNQPNPEADGDYRWRLNARSVENSDSTVDQFSSDDNLCYEYDIPSSCPSAGKTVEVICDEVPQ